MLNRFIAALVVAVPLIASPIAARAQDQSQPRTFTRADTLRGSITPERAWWDVVFYDLNVAVNPADSSIRGWNAITYRVTAAAREMQIDLMTPLEIDSIVQDGKARTFRRDGNAFFVQVADSQPLGTTRTITVFYGGKPRVAKRAPWDGGFVWARDSLGHAWIGTACQGVGASIWWPNKDIQSEEPDSQRIAITVPDSLMNVSNGRLRRVTSHANRTKTYEWFVSNPINNYDVAVNIGTYAPFADKYQGEQGELTLDFHPLAYHLRAARSQFQQVKPMLACFEHWFGPYPWYADGYKLVETPFLGMEHQSAVAYGNHYRNGYLGRDLSQTGLGLDWDFIIIHESGHEWFGNNITARDIADMWIQEGFTNYSEALYVECQRGKAAGAKYVIGLRKAVQNDRPIVGAYNVNDEGSGDMYAKAANMIHTIRQIVNDDEKWRNLLRGLNQTFWHQTVTGEQIQHYINTQTGIDFTPVFTQYLTTTQIPVFEYTLERSTLSYRWNNVVPGFNMPIKVTTGRNQYSFIRPTTEWQTMAVQIPDSEFQVDENFYVVPKAVER